jgi:hypothetical protein
LVWVKAYVFGIASSYLLCVEWCTGKQTRIWRSNWLKGRFSANLGNVFELSQNGYLHLVLIYTIWCSLGFRYFFTEGFGFFYRSWNSIASYKTNPIGLTN